MYISVTAILRNNNKIIKLRLTVTFDLLWPCTQANTTTNEKIVRESVRSMNKRWAHFRI